MKTIGLLGGMSWESTDLYYQQLNKSVQQKLGKLHSAKIVLISVDFAEIEILQRQGLWDDAALYLKEKAIQLEKAGAEGILLCTNTMHKVASAIESSVSVPFIHIADATAKEVLNQNIGKVGLLGTQFTMEQGFYKHRLEEQGINVLVPNQAHRQMVHNIIYDELCLGVIKEESHQKYIHIVEQLILEGAEGIILGCTEICMLIGDTQFSVPLFDTTSIHVQAAVDFALS